jgi:hypothetical protein
MKRNNALHDCTRLGESSTRMGDLLESPHVASLLELELVPFSKKITACSDIVQ